MDTRALPGIAGLCALGLLMLTGGGAAAAPSFTLEQVLSYPYPQELVAAPTGSRIAWVFDRQGIRNIWVAEGPGFAPRRLTDYRADDGQELTQLTFSQDGRFLVYVRGGDHDANRPAAGNLQPDPASSPVQPKLEIWSVPVGGGAPKLLGEGDDPAVSPRGDRVAFVRDQQVWSAPLDGSKPAERLLFCRGEIGAFHDSTPLQWSPEGSMLAFTSRRDDHSFIGVYTSDTEPIRYLAPSTSRDVSPRWSPDGTRIAFVRQPGQGGRPETLLEQHPDPWAIWVADIRTGEAREVWKSPETLWGSFPRTEGGANLQWGAGDRLAFLADLDGWPHLYSLPVSGGTPLLLTPGKFMVEYVAVTPDHRTILYNANTGADPDDDDRRHLFRVPVDAARPAPLTSGRELEWTPVVTGDGGTVAYIGASAQRPPLPMVVGFGGGTPRALGKDQVPPEFPTAALVVPRKIVIRAHDGVAVHCQLFEAPGSAAKKPAVIFVHGGPPRQMLLGWHYFGYYSNAYAVNQYLASRGYIVFSVNYRLGIGYGHAFHHPDHAGPWGAAEYQDVLAAARFLRAYPAVDPQRIGIWGGSYGGYLTALALARNSDLFRAGVDLHGVHDWTAFFSRGAGENASPLERNDAKQAMQMAWKSSPVASISTWKSPVLLIDGDDDRNVPFHQTVDLARRLTAAGIPFEEMVIPDEIHDFLRYSSWVMADTAAVAFLGRKLRVGR